MHLLLILFTAYFSYTAWKQPALFHKYLFYPYHIQKQNQWYRFVTHLFLHADLNHLVMNMLTAFFFLPVLQRLLPSSGGIVLLLLFYLSAGIVASVPDYFKHRSNPSYTAVGASGAVSAVVFCCIYFMPFSTIYVFFIPMPALVYGLLFVGYSIYMGVKNRDNIGHLSHLTGAGYGILIAFLLDSLFTYY